MWEARAIEFQWKILAIPDDDLKWGVACVIDIMSSGHGIARFDTDEKTIGLTGFHIDGDCGEQVIKDIGADMLDLAVTWIREATYKADLAWLCWLFPQVEVHGTSRRDVIGSDRVVWNLDKRKIVKILQLDGAPSVA